MSLADGERWKIVEGDCIAGMRTLPDASVNCCVTSPPYFGLRDYGCEGQIGLEPTPEAYVSKLVEVFREVRRVLRNDGTCWVNLGDSYNAYNGNRGASTSFQSATEDACPALPKGFGLSCKTLKPKDLVGIPWRVAFALQADGWWLRQDIIWSKPNPMPESVQDRCTKAHEYVFLLAKSDRYFYDAEAVKEAVSDNPITAARNRRADNSAVGAAEMHGSSFGQSGKGGYKMAVEMVQNERHDCTIHAGDTTTRKTLCGRSASSEYWCWHWRGQPVNPGLIECERCQEKLRSKTREAITSRNRRSVWTVTPEPYAGAHFATMPTELVKPCIKAGCPEGGIVLDPFAGSGTTLAVAVQLGRRGIGCELNPEYIKLAKERIAEAQQSVALFDNLDDARMGTLYPDD